jgi:tetratricopeptide (TPR) repeat protein
MKAQRTAVMVRYSLGLRLEYALVSYVQYVGKALWPTRLAAFYPRPDAVRGWQVLSAILFLTMVTWLAVESWRRRPYLLVGWLFFLGTLVPMLGLEGVGYEGRQGIADRYAYLPFLGLFIMICWGAAEWSERNRVPVSVLRAVSAVALLALAVTAYRQVGYWQDSTTLWTHALEVTDRNWLAEDKIALQLSDQGKTEEAMPHFVRAQAIVPDDYFSNLHIGVYEQQKGKLREAIDHYKLVINNAKTPPDYRVKAFENMCFAYRGLGDTVHADKCFAMIDKVRSIN